MTCPCCKSNVLHLITDVSTGQEFCRHCAPAGFLPGFVLTLDDVQFLHTCGIDPQIQKIEQYLKPRPRMSQLIEIGKNRQLTSEEKAELQALFLRVARNDVRVLKSET